MAAKKRRSAKKAAGTKAAGKKAAGKKARSVRTPAAKKRRSTATPTQASLEQAGFVFRGTVTQRGAATLDQVPLNQGTLVVTVDEIIKAPEALQTFSEQAITVQLGKGQRVATGQRYVFYTNGWLYGSSLAVVSIGLSPDTETHVAEVRQTLDAIPARSVDDRAKRADLVVSGQVTAIRDATQPDAPITEHDPQWRQATVAVSDVHQSAGKSRKPRQVAIRFAASTDVRWAQAPKFNVGDAGLWMLGDKEDTEHVALRAAAGTEANEFLVVDPADFVPAHLTEQTLAMMPSSRGGKR